jgi:energy-coupling factor transporter ATP-binding protein EcfA2
MRKIVISDVGPITGRVKIVFRRFCVLIGPQSSGKSTIAKLLSTCLWLEKEACTTLSSDVLPNGVDFKKFVEDFHRMHGYIHSESSEVKYESDFVIIQYIRGEFSLRIKPNNKYRRIKVSYIPSDRNVITMKDLELREMESTNFRSFLFDWLYCRKYFNADNKTDILELGVKYYFEKVGGENRDTIIHQNGQTYSVSLYDASSGMQSAVPLVITTQFFTGKYFEVYDKEVSFDGEQRKRDLVEQLVSQYFPAKEDKSSSQQFIDATKAGPTPENAAAYEAALAIRNDFNRLTSPNSTAFIIEEPEQSLFPTSQYEIIMNLLKGFSNGTENSLVLTTHSPYILETINNSIYADTIRKSGKNSKHLIPEEYQISYDNVSAYQIENGEIHSIMDDDIKQINPAAIDKCSQKITDIFTKLTDIDFGE